MWILGGCGSLVETRIGVITCEGRKQEVLVSGDPQSQNQMYLPYQTTVD